MLRSFQFRRWSASADQQCMHGVRSVRRQPLLAALGIEALERRTLFSTFTVLNLADSGEGSLRQAVQGANVLSGADTIDFADGLLGTIALTSGEMSITDGL